MMSRWSGQGERRFSVFLREHDRIDCALSGERSYPICFMMDPGVHCEAAFSAGLDEIDVFFLVDESEVFLMSGLRRVHVLPKVVRFELLNDAPQSLGGLRMERVLNVPVELLVEEYGHVTPLT